MIEPQQQCKHVTKLVPQLQVTNQYCIARNTTSHLPTMQEVEECVDVPKEICTRSRTNPKKVKKPVIKNWCYQPSESAELPFKK